MLVEVSYFCGDTCGNEDVYPMGICEFNSIEEAEREFPKGFLCGWRINKLQVDTPEALKERLKKGRANGTIF